MRISELDDIEKEVLLGGVTVGVCVQCESNARWNEAGGYNQLAEQCRDYCRRGHKEEKRDADD